MAATSSAKRCLFGKASPKSTQAFCKRILNEFHEEKKRQWGFDFHNGVPLPSSSTSTFVYTKLTNEIVPGFYRASVLDRSASSSFSSDNENSDPAPVNVSLDSSMECDEVLVSPKLPVRTPKKQRTIADLVRARKTSGNPRGVSKKTVPSAATPLARRTARASYVAPTSSQ